MTDQIEPTCNVCKSDIIEGATVCLKCKSAQGKAEPCVICKLWIPEGAKRCNACTAYQGRRGYFMVSQTVLTLLVALIAVLSPAITAISYYLDRDSQTSVTVTSANEKAIYLYALNSGRKPSTIQVFRLKFNKLPIDDVELELIDDDQRQAKNFILPGTAKFGVNVSGFRTGVRSIGLPIGVPQRFTDTDIENLMKTEQATLEIEVRESDDPCCLWNLIPFRRFHTRTDTFPAGRISQFIMPRVTTHEH